MVISFGVEAPVAVNRIRAGFLFSSCCTKSLYQYADSIFVVGNAIKPFAQVNG